jgi:hypothetical protein
MKTGKIRVRDLLKNAVTRRKLIVPAGNRTSITDPFFYFVYLVCEAIGTAATPGL